MYELVEKSESELQAFWCVIAITCNRSSWEGIIPPEFIYNPEDFPRLREHLLERRRALREIKDGIAKSGKVLIILDIESGFAREAMKRCIRDVSEAARVEMRHDASPYSAMLASAREFKGIALSSRASKMFEDFCLKKNAKEEHLSKTAADSVG